LGSKEYIKDVIYGRKSPVVPGALLFFLSLMYGLFLRLRRRAYAWGILRTKKLPLRVISVGNLTLGGTGKTPTVIQIAGLLRRKGKRPVVLSRGYGRADESRIVIVSDGGAAVMDPVSGGDEPALISSRLPGVPVVAGSDRYYAGMTALERFAPDVAVLDDGFQHIQLARDLNIVLIDGADPFGTGKLFPAGILREPLAALDRADIVLITRADQAVDLDSLKKTIGALTRARVFTGRYVPRDLAEVASRETMPLASLRGAPVLAFAGIARPDSLVSLLKDLGAEVKVTASYPDHYRYVKPDLDGLARKALDVKAAMLVTTEKDAVRLKGMAPKGIWALTIDLEVIESDDWEEVILSGL
jgi:tetraacyldisaccharide 4'-kinase